MLPRFLDEVVFRGLTVDGRKANIALRRSDRHVVVDVLDKDPSIGVVTQQLTGVRLLRQSLCRRRIEMLCPEYGPE